ncbi:MAG: AMP-binding protein [Verrucomicrobia bacterium]|nr:AMP-binding protein [Verrucomicrobiota bacterium]
MNIIDLISDQARRLPDHPAFVAAGSGPILTYAELIRQADQKAHELRSRGLREYQRCGLKLAEGPGFLVSALAVLRAGACLVPLGNFLPAEETRRAIEASGLHWLLSAEGLVSLLGPPVDDFGDQAFAATNPAYIRFTSGSTGTRKGVLLGHDTIVDRLAVADQALKITPEDRIWFRLPMADHFVVSILLYLSRGATVVLDDVSSAGWNALVQRWRPTIIYGSPTSYEGLLQGLDRHLESVRWAISTTTMLRRKVAHAFESRFGCPLNAALGIIEVGLLTLNPSSDGSVGYPLSGYRVSLTDEHGHLVGLDQVGRLWVDGPGLLDAYLNPWRPRREIVGQFGYCTGDVARLNTSGTITLLGRAGTLLRQKGVLFFCEEVEAALDAIPGVLESRVYYDPISRTVAAEVVTQNLPTAQLPGLLSGQIDDEKIPAAFHQVSAVKRTPNGKLLRAGS